MLLSRRRLERLWGSTWDASGTLNPAPAVPSSSRSCRYWRYRGRFHIFRSTGNSTWMRQFLELLVEQKNLLVFLAGNQTRDAPAAPQSGHSNLHLGLLGVPLNSGVFKQLSNNARRYFLSINDSIFIHFLFSNYSIKKKTLQYRHLHETRHILQILL